jgi:pimeloyl-ACP methyl ester carboxylesterase
MSFADINGTKVYYESAGSGKTLVLVHAGIADSRMWDAQFDCFARQYQVVRYDMRGFGKTQPVAGEFSPVEDLHALLTDLNIPSAWFMGCSKGGTTIMDFALKYPDRVEALVMVTSNPSGYQFVGEIPPKFEELKAAFDAGDLDHAAELEVQIWVDGSGRTPDQVDAAIRDRVREMARIGLKHEKAGIGKEQAPEVKAVDHLADIQVPVLIIAGALDDYELLEAAEKMTAEIPGARMVTIEDTAHLPNIEKPDEFNEHVLAFLEQL